MDRFFFYLTEETLTCMYYYSQNTPKTCVHTHLCRFRILAVNREDDDIFIPFDPPLVSKFGPICRCARMKGRNTAPLQATAEKVFIY